MNTVPSDISYASALPTAAMQLLQRLDARAARFVSGPLLERYSVRSADGGVHTEVRVVDVEPATPLAADRSTDAV